MGEGPKFERPTTPEEEHELTLERSKYLLEHIREQEEQHGIDHLTEVSTRKAFDERLEKSLKMIREEMKGHRESDEPPKGISLIFVDLDNFKNVNDTYGHVVGDGVLKKVAGLLKVSIRDTDMLARYGGDEFVVLLPHTNESEALTVADKLQKTLDDNPELKNLSVTASFGVCSSDELTATDPEGFIKRADDAAYEAKKAGRNRVVVHTNSNGGDGT